MTTPIATYGRLDLPPLPFTGVKLSEGGRIDVRRLRAHWCRQTIHGINRWVFSHYNWAYQQLPTTKVFWMKVIEE